jgi:hypothetical protein
MNSSMEGMLVWFKPRVVLATCVAHVWVGPAGPACYARARARDSGQLGHARPYVARVAILARAVGGPAGPTVAAGPFPFIKRFFNLVPKLNLQIQNRIV